MFCILVFLWKKIKTADKQDRIEIKSLLNVTHKSGGIIFNFQSASRAKYTYVVNLRAK